MIGDAQPDGAAALVFQSARRLARRFQEKSVGSRRVTAQQPVLPVLDDCVLADVGKVAAHQGEMVMAIGLADVADPLERGLVANVAAEGVARVCRVDDDAARTQALDGLTNEPALRGYRMKLQIDTHGFEAMIRA